MWPAGLPWLLTASPPGFLGPPWPAAVFLLQTTPWLLSVFSGWLPQCVGAVPAKSSFCSCTMSIMQSMGVALARSKWRSRAMISRVLGG